MIKAKLKVVTFKLFGETMKKNQTKNLRMFFYYVKQILHITESGSLELEEGQVIEVQYKNITISFTWDMISAINNTTHAYIDLINQSAIKGVFTDDCM